MRQVRDELVAACGGVARATFAQRLVAGAAAIKALRIRMLGERMVADGYPPEEVERRFTWHANSLRRDLQSLGLDGRCVPEPVESWADLVARHDLEPAEAPTPPVSSWADVLKDVS